ncbi:MAG: MCP four helix bundle domain-containing protein [Bacteroidota bacterium]
MGWKLDTAQRVRAGIALVIVFLLILATNLIDNHHFEIVQRSMTSIYEDRLMAKNHIYRISRQLEIKRNLLQTKGLANAAEINQAANDSIKILLERYSETKLTEAESRHFASLKTRMNQLFQQEANFVAGNMIDEELPSLNSNVESFYTGIFSELDALSDIQITEGKRELLFSTKSIDSSNLISKIEIATLILIGIVLQLLIFLKPLK